MGFCTHILKSENVEVNLYKPNVMWYKKYNKYN